MRKEEVENMVPVNYLRDVQTEIKDTSRAFLLEWIVDVHRKFRLQPESLYVTAHLIDQYLSRVQVMKNQLHLLGVGALLISTKYEEIYPPDLRDLLAVSENKFSREQVLTMEQSILHALNFKVTSPSAYRFLERFRRLEDTFDDKEVFFFAQYIQEVAMLDASLLKFTPSQIAAASLILSTKQLKKKENIWGKDLEKFSEYT